MPRVIHAATQTYHFPGELFTPEEHAALTEMTLPPDLLHQCRFGRLEYDWRPTAMVGRFICRGCGIAGLCGVCAELAGQRVPPGVVPACAPCMVDSSRSASPLSRLPSTSLLRLCGTSAPRIPVATTATLQAVLQERRISTTRSPT
jgi:hypothetical protein